MRRLVIVLVALATGLSPLGASAQELRSDSPLWTYEAEPNEALYPRSFYDEESFGCIHGIRTGLYRWTPVDDAGPYGSDPEYWRLDNYGVFHCAILSGTGDSADEANDDFDDYAWVVKLDTVQEIDGSETDLLALQIGIRTGSQYVLLRRPKGDMEHFEQLAAECPPTSERRTARIDIWGQDVCVIQSQDQLRAIAHAAHGRPIAARLDWLSSASESERAQEDEMTPGDAPESNTTTSTPPHADQTTLKEMP